MQVRNIDPNGARMVPVGDTWVHVDGGAVAEFPDELAAKLAEQVDVWQIVEAPKAAKQKDGDA